jgi:hypothetical protein
MQLEELTAMADLNGNKWKEVPTCGRLCLILKFDADKDVGQMG